MPPKASKKAVEKVKTKIVEDKTFGLKNKNKSKKQQEYIKQVTAQVKGKDTDEEKRKFEAKMKKKEQEEKEKFEKELFKPVVKETKVPVGVNPKSVVCELFKVGMCTKGEKCKFSHDVGVARKAEKIDIYTDRRAKEEDSMDGWDQAKLEAVVGQKETKAATNPNKTAIVCKYFLDAIENKSYGWFWDCPNGGDKCMYQHALPPGFVLKSKKKDLDDEEEVLLEDKLEEERAKLTKRTPLTKELFLKWKTDKKKEKIEKDKAEKDKRDSDIRAGRALRSGREMFSYNPDLFQDDLDADVVDISELAPEEDSVPIIEIDVTGTSIRTNITNVNDDVDGESRKDGKEEVGVEESLFVEDEIPDISDDEDD